MSKLSACLCIHNEEASLEACLQTLGFADEIVIALDKCTDRSKEIALAHGAKIIAGNWPLEDSRRNATYELASGDWILEVDCDERISPALAAEIRQVITATPYDLHCIPFDNYIGDTLVKYGWGAYIGVSQKIALFRRGAKSYQLDNAGTRVHPKVTVNGRFGPVLSHAITHYIDKNLSDTIRRFDSYTSGHAKDLIDKGDIGSFGANFRRLFSRFYKSYIRRKGYREGAMGFFIGMLAALYPMVSYLKAKHRL